MVDTPGGDVMEPWQLREFPRSLRQTVVNEAKQRQMSPGQFATRVFTAAHAAGWDRFMAGQTDANGSTAPGSPAVEEAAAIATLVDAACKLASTKGVTKAVRGAANRTLAQQLAGYVRALPAPEPPQGA
jgi:hypothetical protein